MFLSECRCGKGFDKHANICACVCNEVCVYLCCTYESVRTSDMWTYFWQMLMHYARVAAVAGAPGSREVASAIAGWMAAQELCSATGLCICMYAWLHSHLYVCSQIHVLTIYHMRDVLTIYA